MRPRLLLPLLFLLLPVAGLAEPLRLAVSVAPLAWLVQQVGGDQVQVQTLVRSGQDPHGFEPAPTQLAQLAQARAYLALDLPFEQAWLPRMLAVNPQLKVVSLIGPDAATERDPHLWLNPRTMIDLSERLAAMLGAMAPDQRLGFSERQRAVAATLTTLDAALAARFKPRRGETFLVHHPAWGHFAARYGLTQLAIERDGKEPGPRALAELTEQVRRLGIDTLFIEPQASEHLAHGLADTLGLRIVALDPMAADYPANLRRAAAAIEAALR